MNLDSIPIPAQLKVGRKTVLNDLLADLVVAIISIPNRLGGSVLANVNPVHGLYSLIIGTPVAALFTGSALMNVDATSATALATRDALTGIPSRQQLDALVVLVGVFMIVFGLLRLGSLTRFISNAVMTGFLTGIATLTILGQVSNLTGYSSLYSNRVLQLLDTFLHFDQVDLPNLVVGLRTIAAILLINRTRLSRYSFPIALRLATLAVPLLGLTSVALVGDSSIIQRSLSKLQMPHLALITDATSRPAPMISHRARSVCGCPTCSSRWFVCHSSGSNSSRALQRRRSNPSCAW